MRRKKPFRTRYPCTHSTGFIRTSNRNTYGHIIYMYSDVIGTLGGGSNPLIDDRFSTIYTDSLTRTCMLYSRAYNMYLHYTYIYIYTRYTPHVYTPCTPQKTTMSRWYPDRKECSAPYTRREGGLYKNRCSMPHRA